MKENARKVDYTTWDRTKLFDSYRGTDLPYIIVTADLDVTNLYRYVKEEGISYHFSFLYLAAKAANEIKNFHYRIIDGEVWEIEENVAVTTHLKKGSERFVMSVCEPYPDMLTYAKKNREAADRVSEEDDPRSIEVRNDILNCSSIPWISYSAFIRTIGHLGVDSNPKLTLGKYRQEGERILMPFSCQTHHGLMDGLHVGRFYEKIQAYIDEELWS